MSRAAVLKGVRAIQQTTLEKLDIPISGAALTPKVPESMEIAVGTIGTNSSRTPGPQRAC
jgi:hypothetical protein